MRFPDNKSSIACRLAQLSRTTPHVVGEKVAEAPASDADAEVAARTAACLAALEVQRKRDEAAAAARTATRLAAGEAWRKRRHEPWCTTAGTRPGWHGARTNSVPRARSLGNWTDGSAPQLSGICTISRRDRLGL